MASATVYRKDYIPPTHWVDSVHLEFDLHPQQTHVHSTLIIRPNEDRINNDLVLNGRDLELVRIVMDGRELDRTEYTLMPNGDIVLRGITKEIKLEIENIINPQANTSLMGLYLSKGNFMTQCEAEGFRRITYYPDRPDISAKFTVRINAPKSVCPVLLSNGNLVEEGELDGNWHYTCWEDPFPKPSYLFALVAGNLKCREEKFQLKNGKKALLQIWVEPQNLDKTEFALESLKRAIAWDEERFGLELDLERFMIVATDDFTMGAMENKGLNIFNSRCVLATPEVATDRDFARIESVIGHEYFHNWTGNRVTCRDWFQLTLKEGLTVFREQEVDLVVILGDGGDKRSLRVSVPALLIPLQRLGAICGQHLGALRQRLADELLLGRLLAFEILPVDMGHGTFQRTVGTVYFIRIKRVRVGRRDLQIYQRTVLGRKYQLTVVLCVPEGVQPVHVAEDIGHLVIVIHEI